MPPTPVGKILLAAKLRSGIPWREYEAQLQIRKATREFWMNGHVSRLPLYPLMALAEALGITGLDFMTAVNHSELPDWAVAELKRFFDAQNNG